MSNTNQIFDKVNALKEQEENPKGGPPKRKGAWADVEQFEDPESHLGVIVRKRIRGRPAYCYSLVHFDDRGPNRYIPHPLEAARPVEEVIYLLVQKAKDCIAEERKKDRADRPRPKKGKKKGKGSDHAPAKSDGIGTGLSALARADAEAKGQKYVGKTERKRKKKSG